MAKTKAQKQEMIAHYTELLSNATGIIVVEQEGLTPEQITAFKRKLNAIDSEYHVIKNTLFSIALKNADLPEMDVLQGNPHSVLFSSSDIAATAKALDELIKENKDKVQVKAGILEGQLLDEAQAKALADLPSKEQSVAMIAGILNQSLSGVVNVLEDSMRSLVIILDQAFASE